MRRYRASHIVMLMILVVIISIGVIGWLMGA